MISTLIFLSIEYFAITGLVLSLGVIKDDDKCIAYSYKWPLWVIDRIKEAQENVKKDKE